MSRVSRTAPTSELKRLLSAHFGDSKRITEIRARESPFASSHLLEEVDVVMDDGCRLRLICKGVSRDGMLAEARQVKPDVVTHAPREVEMYQAVLGDCADVAPTCFGTLTDPFSRQHWLVLERIDGLELRRVGEFEVWETAMARLGSLHTRAANRVRSPCPEEVPAFARYDDEFFRQWPFRAVQIAERSDGQQALGRQAALAQLAERYDPVAGFLSALPWTVIHGDCFPSNVLVENNVDGQRICFIDWEMAAFGPGLIDVAALTAGSWSELEREHLVWAYRVALEAAGERPPSLDELLHQLDYCRLHLAMQFLGWSSNWAPPSEQEHDWLGEALLLAEALLP
jgi:hypothetical protein